MLYAEGPEEFAVRQRYHHTQTAGVFPSLDPSDGGAALYVNLDQKYQITFA
ncbi:MAG: hypothetical protein IPP10_16605 [Candidatus Competibacteraceae bacterium]|nr:hypothetical protein [Candidatus Competibacteraceae bacterium]